MPSDVQYSVSLDDSDVLKALDRIEDHLWDLVKIGDASFGKLEDIADKEFRDIEKEGKRAADNTGKSFKKMGVVIGAVAGVVQQLANQFIYMAQQIPRAFGAIIGDTIEANKLFEKFSTQFTTLLGSSQAAQERVKELIEFNIRTPFELSEIVEASRVLQVFGGSALATGENLQMVGDIAAGVNRNFDEVALWIGRAYDALQNGRPWGMAALALQRMGALSGDARAEIERLQEEGERGEHVWRRFVELVGMRFAGNMERLAGTMAGVTSNLEDFRVELLRLSGEKFFEGVRDDLIRLFELLDENREPLVNLGIAFGDIAASIEKVVVSGVLDQLESIEPTAIEDLADAMTRLAEAIDRASDKKTQGNITGLIEALTNLVDINTSLLNVAERLKKPVDELKESIREKGVVGEIVVNTFETLQTVLGNLTNPLKAITELVNQGTDAWYNLNAELEKAVGFSLVDLTEDVAEATAPDEPYIPDMSRFTRREEGVPPIVPAIDDIEEGLDEIETEYDKFLKRLNDLDIDRGRRLLDINSDYQRKLLEDEIDAAQKREDLARRNAQRIEDIYRKYQEGLADAARDLSRTEEDIARDVGRKRIEVERDNARERLDIETEYRRELQRIRNRFNDSAAEAERRNDAQAYLEAVRQRDRDIRDAKLGRQERIEDTKQRAAEQREEVNRQLQYEIEDARIANRRKLEDLQIRLDRELEAQRLNYQRDLEEQAITEQRKRDERLRAYNQELEDYRLKEGQRLDDLQRALDTEYKKIDANERRILQLRISRAREAVEAINAINNQLRSTSVPSYYRPAYGTERRQEGGPVEIGQPYIVGERGPELFIPAASGMVLPNQAINLPATPGLTTVSNVSTTVSPTFNVAEDLFNNPVAVRKLQNLILGVMVENL